MPVRQQDRSPGRTVAILAYDGMTAFEMGIAAEIFGLSELSESFWPDMVRPWYTVQLCTETTDPVGVVGGATLQASFGLSELAAAHTVIIPSISDIHRPVSPTVIAAVRQAAERGARLVSICSGAFVLAAAGVLDGRRATTHWRYADALQERHPAVEVDRKPLYIDEGDVLTSAGCSAGLDLCLHIVRNDHGPAVANEVARSLVVAPHRSGGQAQFIENPMPALADDTAITDSMNWALAHIGRPLSLDDLAAQAQMSRRSYLRQFTKTTGATPISWLIARRIDVSTELLETSTESVERVAALVGFASVVTFRHHFTRLMHTTPSQYRATFRSG
jgi:transcriptional regulator GlxA family with amidase domain